jgi:hypothetical protein
MNSREDDVWLDGIVDRDLLLLSTNETWFSLPRMGDPQDLLFQQWSRRELKDNGIAYNS